jgi:hypothetical protein
MDHDDVDTGSGIDYFSFVDDDEARSLLHDVYFASIRQGIADANIWEWLKNYDGHTPKWGEHMGLDLIAVAIQRPYSMESFVWALQNMGYIAKHGWDNYALHYRNEFEGRQV